MANECIDAWKKAKTAFESATNKKKPSEKVLGIFRKGTGIEAACKAVDAATTSNEAKQKAVATFKTACTSYLTLLEKTANDPKEVKSADKSAYISAILSLKIALKAIETDACKTAATGTPASKEAPSDAKGKTQDQLIKEANDHIALRQKVLKDATALSGQMKTTITSLNERLAKVQAQANAAKQAAAKSDVLNQNVAIGVIDQHITEAEGIVEKAQKSVDGFQDGGGDFMKARGDLGTVFDAIAKPKGTELKATRDKVWSPVTNMAADNITQVKVMDSIVQKMEAAKAEATSHGGEGKSVKEYLQGVLTLEAEMKSLLKDLHIKSDRVTQSVQQWEEQVAKRVKLPDAKGLILKHCQLMEDQWKRYGPEMAAIKDRLGAMKTRATSLPKNALEDKAIAKAAASAGKTADDGIIDINKQLKDGADLDLKIAATRKKYP